MSARIYSAEKRAEVIADYQTSGDTVAAVAARHGIARATVGNWTNGTRDGFELTGGQWVIDPRRRIQVWEAS